MSAMSSNGEQANKPPQNGAPVCPTSPSKRVAQRRDLRIDGAGRRAPPTQAADFSRVDGWPNHQRLARVLGAPPLVAVTGGSARGVCPGPRPPPPRHHTNIPRGVERHSTKHVNQTQAPRRRFHRRGARRAGRGGGARHGSLRSVPGHRNHPHKRSRTITSGGRHGQVHKSRREGQARS